MIIHPVYTLHVRLIDPPDDPERAWTLALTADMANCLMQAPSEWAAFWEAMQSIVCQYLELPAGVLAWTVEPYNPANLRYQDVHR